MRQKQRKDRTYHYKLLQSLGLREVMGSLCSSKFSKSCHATEDIVKRLGLEAELEGHTGCVNCLEWNENARLLASGSDDLHVILWDPFSQKCLTKMRTIHTGNIFSVKFLPNSCDRHIVTAAADHNVTVLDLERKETLHIFSDHKARVKRLAVSPDLPGVMFSAGEDGMIMQFDLRSPESSNHAIIDLSDIIGAPMQAKCLSISPTHSELLAVGADDPFIRLFDRRMLRVHGNSELSASPSSEKQQTSHYIKCFVPGHIPSKVNDYSKRFRMLAATYVTFSPDGLDLLVNLGGEQIYLYNVNESKPVHVFDAEKFHSWRDKGDNTEDDLGDAARPTNGYKYSAITPAPNSCALPRTVEILKQRANHEFERQNYHVSVALYNQAIHRCGHAAVLYSNRAAALMKRNWDGDIYAALNDCVQAITLNRLQHKAYYRLCRCLLSLSRVDEAAASMDYFTACFPSHAVGHAFESLVEEIKRATALHKAKHDNDSDAEKKDAVPVLEQLMRSQACDYSQRFCGHCNTTTDIKEANFLGSNGQYICAGSDDGSFFIWDRNTTNIVRVMKGDDSIVNCIQPHPEICLLATSGIEQIVRIWSPRPEGIKQQHEVDNLFDAATANQRRMNADPLETMLLNMGYHLSRSSDTLNDGDGQPNNDLQCRPF